MSKKVLDVGNCQPDHSALKTYLTGHFDCQVVQAHGMDDTMSELKTGSYDLVLINRKLDRDYSDGLEILKEIKADAGLASLPVMLITNFPDHQDAAEEAGALRGFGKLEYDKSETRDRLAAVLE